MSKKPWIRGALVRVAALPFPGIENAWVFISGKRKQPTPLESKHWHWRQPDGGLDYPDRDMESRSFLSFAYIDDEYGIAAEWDGDCGPIQMYFREKPDPTSDEKPRDHWVWDEAYGAGHWSQLAVGRAGFPQAFLSGGYDRIFAELRHWVQARIKMRGLMNRANPDPQ
jgi:hypothetical protein